MGSWRLLRDPPGPAAWNMAVDEALLLCGAGPVLRLYGWTRPTVSLGYRRAPPSWLDRCASLGVDVVRRATGGGAVLHAGDLTYAVAAPQGTPELSAGLRASYEWIRARLLEGLGQVGLAVAPSHPADCADRAELCFAGATGMEIDLTGVKLVGSAQRRARAGVLQHGSIRLGDDRALYRALIGSVPGSPSLPPSTTVAAVAAAIESAFRTALDGGLEASELSPVERAVARERANARRAAPLVAPPLA